MPLTENDLKDLGPDRLGCPTTVRDRLAAFEAGVLSAIRLLAPRVSVDGPAIDKGPELSAPAPRPKE